MRTPSGRSHSAGAVRRCEVSRLKLCGLPSVVSSDAAVPSNLCVLACDARVKIGGRVLGGVLLVGPCLQRAQQRRQEAINRHRVE